MSQNDCDGGCMHEIDVAYVGGEAEGSPAGNTEGDGVVNEDREAQGSDGATTAIRTALAIDQILGIVLSHLSALDMRRTACVCKSWRSVLCNAYFTASRRLILVTASGSNEIVLLDGRGWVTQRIRAAPPTRRRASGKKSRRLRYSSNHRDHRDRGRYCWPTCMAPGPRNQLYVSQYKVSGILEYRRTLQGYTYRRTLISEASYTSPEGLVCAHGSLYVVSVEHGTISRLTPEGRLLERAPAATGLRPQFWILWGMCASPDKKRLLIAAHTDDGGGGDYRRPTVHNSGRILCIDLEADGSFQQDPEREAPVGYYYPPSLKFHLRLNRPSNPAFCHHGILHVSSFISEERGTERRIYKSTFGECPSMDEWQHHLGWIEADPEDAELLAEPWGIGFSGKGDLYATCHSPRVPSVIRLASCGCPPGMVSPLTHRPAEKESSNDDLDGNVEPRPFCCGRVTMLSPANSMDQANYVMPT